MFFLEKLKRFVLSRDRNVITYFRDGLDNYTIPIFSLMNETRPFLKSERTTWSNQQTVKSNWKILIVGFVRPIGPFDYPNSNTEGLPDISSSTFENQLHGRSYRTQNVDPSMLEDQSAPALDSSLHISKGYQFSFFRRLHD